jgi:hypothetical protein
VNCKFPVFFSKKLFPQKGNVNFHVNINLFLNPFHSERLRLSAPYDRMLREGPTKLGPQGIVASIAIAVIVLMEAVLVSYR